MAGASRKLWILRLGLIAVLAGLLAWRVAGLIGGEDVPAQPVFDRAGWESEYLIYLEGEYGISDSAGRCVVDDLKKFGDEAIESYLATDTIEDQLPFASSIVKCARYQAEASSYYVEYLTADGLNCALRKANALSDDDLARVIASPYLVDQMTRECGGDYDVRPIKREPFDRAVWKEDLARYLSRHPDTKSKRLVPCALDEIKKYSDSELETRLERDRRLLLAQIRVECDRRGAVYTAAYSERLEPYGAQLKCTTRTAGAMPDHQLAKVVSSPGLIDGLYRDCATRQ